MQRRFFILVTAMAVVALLSSKSSSEEVAPASGNSRERPTGIITHGGDSALFEDFYGGRVEKMPPEPGRSSGKHDPVLRWNETPTGR